MCDSNNLGLAPVCGKSQTLFVEEVMVGTDRLITSDKTQSTNQQTNAPFPS